MDDHQIVDLFILRTETAIAKAAEKYGKYCYHIAYSILQNEQDSEECVNETYFRAWNTIPPQKPDRLATFLGKITRNLALDQRRYGNREKRGGGQITLAIDELDECVPAKHDMEQIVSDRELAGMLDLFLARLPEKRRKIFVRRYWYFSPVSEIAKDYAVSESSVKVTLFRTRRELKHFLEREGVAW